MIECENQVLGEDLPLIGSEQRIHYRSDRVPGRAVARTIDIPLVGATVPATLARIDLTVEIAGQRFEQSFAPETGLDFSYTWDGRDGYGRKMNGAQEASIRIDYVYDLIEYLQPAQVARAWARPGLQRIRQRSREMSQSQSMTTTLGSFEPSPTDLGGWTLSAHHRYDPVGEVLYLGDGRRRSADDIGLLGRRFAGQIGDPED